MGLVNLKGTGTGIILELDPAVSFDVLLCEIANKFRESKSFLGRASMGMIIRGRTIYDKEENEILDTISNNCNINVCCVIRDDPDTDRIFASYVKQPEIEQKEESSSEEDTPTITEALEKIKDQAMIHYGNLRSGQALTFDRSVVIMGDVKPGASVTSDGCIFVLGALRGSAFAGASGDEDAFVLALELDPLQIRIADKIAISPDSDEGPKLKFKGFMKNTPEKKTEVAYVFEGHIIKDVYGAAFLRDNRFI